jgi:hypothetical protein
VNTEPNRLPHLGQDGGHLRDSRRSLRNGKTVSWDNSDRVGVEK